MQPDFAHADYKPKKIFDRSGITHHLVSLEFGQVDDNVGFQGFSGNFQMMEGPCFKSDRNGFLKGCEMNSGLLNHVHYAAFAGDVLGFAQPGRVSYADTPTSTLGHKNDLAYDFRMSGNGFLRALAGQHIGLDKDILTGFDKAGNAP